VIFRLWRESSESGRLSLFGIRLTKPRYEAVSHFATVNRVTDAFLYDDADKRLTSFFRRFYD